MDHPGDSRVLLGDALLGVDQQQRHVAAADGGDGPQHAVALQGFLLDGTFAADAGGVDDIVAPAGAAFKMGVDGVPGGAGDVAHHHAVLAQQLIGQAAFAHVGPAHQRQLDLVQAVGLVLLCLRLGRQLLDDLFQQIAQAQHVGGGDANGIAQPQTVELIEHVVQSRVVQLVHCQQHGLAGAAEQGGHFLIVRGQALPGIAEKADHIRGVNGDFRLVAHLAQQRVVAAGIDAAGIDHGKFPAHPFHVGVDAVPGDAGNILHNGHAMTGDLVKKGGFSHIGAANDGHKRFDVHLLSFIVSPAGRCTARRPDWRSRSGGWAIAL